MNQLYDSLTATEKRLAAKGRLMPKPYITMLNRGVFKVSCKCCGETIRKHLPVEDLTIKRTVKNTTIIQERLLLCSLANYREVLLVMDDGSKHVTCVCANCAQHLSDPDVLLGVYLRDVEAWIAEGDERISMHLARKPIQVLRVADVIQGE